MSETAGRYAQLYANHQRGFWIAICVLMGAGFLAANFHLLSVAFNSQPNCVAHTKTIDGIDGSFRAAKSSCKSTVSK